MKHSPDYLVEFAKEALIGAFQVLAFLACIVAIGILVAAVV